MKNLYSPVIVPNLETVQQPRVHAEEERMVLGLALPGPREGQAQLRQAAGHRHQRGRSAP